MAKILGIEEAELEDMPASIAAAIRHAHGEAEKNSGLAAKLEALEAQINPKETEEQRIAREKKEKEVVNGQFSPEQIMLFDNRMDTILLRMLNSSDKMEAATVKLFENEIREVLTKKSNPAARADETYIRNVINMIKGQHMNEILAHVRDNKQDSPYTSLFTESAGSSLPNSEVKKSASEILTDEQKKAADTYGIPHDKFLESLKEVGGVTN